MPLQVPIDLYNALKEYMQDAVGLLADVHLLDPKSSHLLFPYHSLTIHLLRQFVEKFISTVDSLNELAVQLLEFKPDTLSRKSICDETDDLSDEITVAIRKSANEVLYNRDSCRLCRQNMGHCRLCATSRG